MFPEKTALRYFLIALLLFALVRLFFFDFAAVEDHSMVPSILDGEILLVARSAYNLRLPFGGGILFTHSRPFYGEIVVLQGPPGSGKLIKRVVALPGDRLRFQKRTLFVNGIAVRFFRNRLADPFDGEIRTIPPNHLFVLGDNSDNSMDSMDFGPVSERALLGRAIFRFFPVSRAGKVR